MLPKEKSILEAIKNIRYKGILKTNIEIKKWFITAKIKTRI